MSAAPPSTVPLDADQLDVSAPVGKVLVATSRTQGQRDTDFNRCVDGELVWVPPVCELDFDNPAAPCGCGRAFTGLATHRTTTTVIVAFTRPRLGDLIATVGYSLAHQGVIAGVTGRQAADKVAEVIDRVLGIASHYPPGTVLESRFEKGGWRVAPR